MADTTKPVDRPSVPSPPRAAGTMPVAEPRPVPLSPKDRERLEELRAKAPNPHMLPPNTRTEDEENEFRKLSNIVADADRQAALDAARPEVRMSPKQRLAELKGKGDLGEGEEIDRRRLEELMADEARVEVLKGSDKRSLEEDAELAMLRDRVRDARVAGGFDPNG